MTALLREVALFIPVNECNSPVVPSRFDRLMSGYRFTQTALLGDSIVPGTWLSSTQLTDKEKGRYLGRRWKLAHIEQIMI